MHVSGRVAPCLSRILAEQKHAREAQTESSHAIQVGLFASGCANKPARGEEWPLDLRLRNFYLRSNYLSTLFMNRIKEKIRALNVILAIN